jgi:transglutaminase-like putative cysteine protease
MDYSVRHVTRFRYSSPITESVMQVYMQPRREGVQHCPSFELTTSPRARITACRDSLGNIAHHFDVPGPHDELTVTARALVTILPPPALPDRLDPSTWSAVDAAVAAGDFVEMLIPSHFARPSRMLRDFARELEVARRDDPLGLLREITTGVHRSFAYTPESTRVDSTIDEALANRQGVCQDYAHVMISLVRELGVPCRYVSGYLYRPPAAGGRASVSETHAWVEAYLPPLGWVGFDPTNDEVVRDGHIRVAIGRDYADVPPTRGVFKGDAETELGVAVQVALGDDLAADDELLLVTRRASSSGRDGEQPLQQQQQTTGARRA